MRLHRLEIQAFGPFAGKEVIDFDALAAQGLFLLNGPTGAGKTSVLDAIAYALYGQIPGARQNAIKSLRSHHAAIDLGPEVLCEFSVGGRRLEVRRSPEWMRPAKRGGGTTKEQASTQLRELKDGVWMALSQRNDEAAAQIQQLLGMNMAQFTKVILLAQGDFAAFLRANAKDREELLEKLFGTQIYQDLENRLAVDAKEASSLVAVAAAQLASLEEIAKSQAQQVVGTDAGTGPEGSGSFSSGASSGSVEKSSLQESKNRQDQEVVGDLALSGLELFDSLAAAVASSLATAESLSDTAASKASVQATEVEQAHLKIQRHALFASTVAESSRLSELAQQVEEWQNRLAGDLQAQVLAPRLERFATASKSVNTAQDAAKRHQQEFNADQLVQSVLREESLSGSFGLDKFTESHSEGSQVFATLELTASALSAQMAHCDAAMPLADLVAHSVVELGRVEQQIDEFQKILLTQSQASALRIKRQLEIDVDLTELRKNAVGVPQATAQAQAAAELLNAVELFTDKSIDVEKLAALELQDREHYLAAKDTWLAAVESRLLLAAGEIASHLVPGEPCQVCGSVEHPEPSTLAGSSAEAVAAEKSAKEIYLAAESKHKFAVAALEEVRNHLAVLEGQGGATDPRTAAEKSQAAKKVLAQAQEAARNLDELTREYNSNVQDELLSQQEITAATAGLAGAEAEQKALEKESLERQEILATATGDFPSLSDRQKATSSALKVTTDLRNSLQDLSARVTGANEAAEDLRTALDESSFDSIESARSELLESEDRLKIANKISSYEAELTLNKAQLASPEVAQAKAEASVGNAALSSERLAELKEEAARSQDQAHSAAANVMAAKKIAQLLADSTRRYQKLAQESMPLRERAELLSGLSEATRGGSGNLLNMTLSSYVLAARLEQVAQAASLRLTTMSGGRYTLSHSDAKAGRNRKSGLGLEVVDEWTQISRDTSTLSGGESFMASLALALGLADVVQQESGGLDIETLFVDEGFGSLDEESLDQVMDALEGLRDGGRVVGLVSHVAEMKSRIPVHLNVEKGRKGSTLSLREI